MLLCRSASDPTVDLIGAEVSERSSATSYVGQVERDPAGGLWAVLYHGDRVMTKEQVPSLRKGRRRVTDLVLCVADALAERPCRATPTHLNRMVATKAPVPRHRHAPVAGVG
jgi:hypothetical protein